MADPVCHISPDLPLQEAPLPRLPAIPTPNGTIDGIMATLMALKYMVEMLAGQRNGPSFNPTNYYSRPEIQNNYNDNGGLSGFKTNKARFIEVNRTVKQHRVYNPTDKGQYVDVETVDALKMVDKVTGETWEWKR